MVPPFPYYSHTTPIVWEAYRKGVPLLGVPENPIEVFFFTTTWGDDVDP